MAENGILDQSGRRRPRTRVASATPSLTFMASPVAERQRRHGQVVIDALGHLAPRRVLKTATVRRDGLPSIFLDTSP